MRLIQEEVPLFAVSGDMTRYDLVIDSGAAISAAPTGSTLVAGPLTAPSPQDQRRFLDASGRDVARGGESSPLLTGQDRSQCKIRFSSMPVHRPLVSTNALVEMGITVVQRASEVLHQEA